MMISESFFSPCQVCFAWESHPSLGTWRCWASCRRRILAPTPWNCPTTTSPCRSWWGRWWFHVNMLTLWVFQKCEFATFGLELDVLGLWCVMLLFACRRSVGVTSHRRLLLCKQGSSKMLWQPDQVFTMLSIFARILVLLWRKDGNFALRCSGLFIQFMAVFWLMG